MVFAHGRWRGANSLWSSCVMRPVNSCRTWSDARNIGFCLIRQKLIRFDMIHPVSVAIRYRSDNRLFSNSRSLLCAGTIKTKTDSKPRCLLKKLTETDRISKNENRHSTYNKHCTVLIDTISASEMTYIVLSGALNSTHALTHWYHCCVFLSTVFSCVALFVTTISADTALLIPAVSPSWVARRFVAILVCRCYGLWNLTEYRYVVVILMCCCVYFSHCYCGVRCLSSAYCWR